jgi:hypothetical protein
MKRKKQKTQDSMLIWNLLKMLEKSSGTRPVAWVHG